MLDGGRDMREGTCWMMGNLSYIPVFSFSFELWGEAAFFITEIEYLNSFPKSRIRCSA